MGKSKRYLGMVFSENINKIIPPIEKHVDIDKPLYQMFTVKAVSISFVSFFSKSKLADLKEEIYNYNKKNDFMLFDIDERGETFDMNCKGLEDYILLKNLVNMVEGEEPVKLEETVMDLDSLLELVNKNGWRSLTEKQKERLKDYSKE